MMQRKTIALLVTIAAFVTVSTVPTSTPVRADERLMPRDIRAFRLDDQRATASYRRALKLDLGGAKMKFAARFGESDARGAVVTAKKSGDQAFAFALVQRRFGLSWSAQLSVRLLDVRTGGQAGLEADLFDGAGALQSFTFAGVTPNPGISGVSGFANKDSVFVGKQVDFPGTDAVDILLTQSLNRFTIEMRASGPNQWQTVYDEAGTQPGGRQIGFGASKLGKGNRVALLGLEAAGEVNGALERRRLRGIRGIRGIARDFRVRVRGSRIDLRGAESSLRRFRVGADVLLRLLRSDREDGLYRDGKRVRDTFKLIRRARRQGAQALKVLQRLNVETKSVAFAKSPEDKLRKLADKILQDLALSTGGLRGWKTKKPKQLPVVLVVRERR